ncbi:uncharacterized protein F4807DRAFT_470387 [Annulohypoxylon truncatum]|uniref:uncharacterized protein n=1 Tax=Annulohypoxylon truncatum TaxID=327061 RepID=UPI002007B4FB|nr:uncharacterized protein F4807DRAFT_470387 [Annulohypoxylon truncatum]KAI1206188.1 hypothetical protein F4807DRAFT_470387 [Annulohypoxylon truncatum]
MADNRAKLFKTLGVRYLSDGQPIYTTDNKTRLQLERESQELWKRVRHLQNLLDHLPPNDSRIVEPISNEEFMKIEDYIHRAAVRVHPTVDGPQFSEAYKFIEENIIKLADDWIAPYKNDPQHGEDVANAALKDGTASGVVTWLLKFPDIAKLTRYDTQGTLVIRAIIARWLYLEIFSKGLSGTFPHFEALIDDEFLKRTSNPKRSILEQRRWFQLTYASMIAHPYYPRAREIRTEQLANELQQLFTFLDPQDLKYEHVLTNIITPAMRLQEQAALTIQQHSFNFYHLPTDPAEEFLQQFAGLASKVLVCEDITRASRTIEFGEENQEELAKNVLPICSLGPVITYKDPEKAPTQTTLTLRALTLCVDEADTRNAEFLQTTRPGIFYHLLTPFPRHKAASNI